MINPHALMIGNASTLTSVSTGGASYFLAGNVQVIGVCISFVALISAITFYVLNYLLSLERRRESRARHREEMRESAARIKILEGRYAALPKNGDDNG